MRTGQEESGILGKGTILGRRDELSDLSIDLAAKMLIMLGFLCDRDRVRVAPEKCLDGDMIRNRIYWLFRARERADQVGNLPVHRSIFAIDVEESTRRTNPGRQEMREQIGARGRVRLGPVLPASDLAQAIRARDRHAPVSSTDEAAAAPVAQRAGQRGT